jgi:hypothetical protein
MKKAALITVAILAAIPLTVGFALAGNGAPSGTHYNLNLLGKATCPGDDLTGTNRHTIMVKLNFSDPDANDILGDNPGNIVTLDKTNKLFLASGADFQVTDGNACDKGGAAFTMPANVATAWEVYLRELAKPGGTGHLTTCGIDAGLDGIAGTADDGVMCSSNNVLLVRNTGKISFRNVTDELTSMTIQVLTGYDDLGNPIYEEVTIPVFDSMLYQYFWDYDNNGLRPCLRLLPILSCRKESTLSQRLSILGIFCWQTSKKSPTCFPWRRRH